MVSKSTRLSTSRGAGPVSKEGFEVATCRGDVGMEAEFRTGDVDLAAELRSRRRRGEKRTLEAVFPEAIKMDSCPSEDCFPSTGLLFPASLLAVGDRKRGDTTCTSLGDSTVSLDSPSTTFSISARRGDKGCCVCFCSLTSFSSCASLCASWRRRDFSRSRSSSACTSFCCVPSTASRGPTLAEPPPSPSGGAACSCRVVPTSGAGGAETGIVGCS